MSTTGLPVTAASGGALRSAGLAALGVAVAVTAALSIAVGAKQLPPSTVLDALLHLDRGDPDHLIVVELRVPRTLIGLLAGAALGLAGAMVQGLTRNPLADPGILGVNAGAALAVVLAISVLGVGDLSGYVWFGFAGAAAAVVLVYGIGSLGRDGATPLKITLAGAALTAALGSFTTAVLLTDTMSFDQFRFWQVGGLAGRDAAVVAQAAPFLAVAMVLALCCGRVLNALALGDDMARAWGRNVAVSRAVCGLAIVLLSGGATALAGPIAFVGLAVPHLARFVTGPDHRWLLPYSMLLGPLLLLAADIAGRVVARPGEIQAGIVTAVIGAPVLVALARRRKAAAS
ncbi:FecCD family ABC transporter permease [Thermomonospora cellulosilytica]|uniref:Iron complex transport system permease protein n=1 Tax=Thermomonospora cellulosilytica TaxID=1411118 RepID=A0A7W3R8W8_9ACTN|nr:iron chelate uptake ABC transporter family permease subunit [Thermomonospora cellulosilytica]MBA9004034.1 iron complex transport system permease protein [Thermomonospora cellulosilytica]